MVKKVNKDLCKVEVILFELKWLVKVYKYLNVNEGIIIIEYNFGYISVNVVVDEFNIDISGEFILLFKDFDVSVKCIVSVLLYYY